MDQADGSVTIIENLDAASGALTKEDTVTPVAKESKRDQPEIGKRNIKDKTGNEMSKTTNVDAKERKVAPAGEKKGLKRKAEHPSTSEMVLDSIKALRKRNGATFDDIGKYMEEKYSVSMKTLKSHINKFLKKSVDDGVLEKIEGVDAEGKFKIKKSEDTKRSSKNLLGKGGKAVSVSERKGLKRKAEHPPTSNIKKSEDTKRSSKNLLGKEGKAISVSERKGLKRKAEHPPTSEMVLDSIKALRKRNGATFEDIGKYMEEKYSVNMKTLKSQINKFLKKSVDDGVLEKIDGAGAEEKFKIKKSEDTKKSSKNLLGKEGKAVSVSERKGLKRKAEHPPTSKIKKSEDTKRSSKNVIGKKGKGKPIKKMIATKQKIKK